MTRAVNGIEAAGWGNGDIVTPTLAEQAYVSVRDLLITGRILPGQLIQEGELSKQLGVGRTPVREALKRLEVEQMVKIYPRRGVFAADVRLSDLALLAEVRVELEGQAARAAATRATAAQRARLGELLIESNAPRDGKEAEIAFDERVHRVVYQCAGNPYLVATLSQYYNLTLQLWHLFIGQMPQFTQHVGVLTPVLQYVIEGDGPEAQRAMADHVANFAAAVKAVR